ncbi:MAG: DUF3078 domain-containing protein [Saprospiraceae bacterium]|nr:DUF3078 domain-containing protein [Saprospiraceae bacterium]
MRKFYLISLLFLFAVSVSSAQTLEELQSLKSEKAAQAAEIQGQLDAVNGEIAGIDAQLDAFPGWETGAFGTIGLNFNRFTDWAKGANPNSTSTTISGSFNGFANYDQPKLFWRNSGNIAIGWQKLDTDTKEGSDTDLEQVADVFRINSLLGYKLSDKWAVSALADYNTSILSNFNDPGILDIGVGATWTPFENFLVVIHPLNYHIIMGDDPAFENATGAKIVADYGATFEGITWRTNFNTFVPYKSNDPNLGEWTWTNSFSANVWKGIGVGIEFAFRKADIETTATQNYFLLGLSYGF